jgi:Prolyl-tRNA synthetase
MSTLFLRTLREDPADAELPSHRLLVRAGYIRRVAPGIYTWLPLGLKVLRNVERIVREEMDAIGAQELSFPALLPKEPFEATGRWTEYGENIFRLKDRKGADYLLGPTHEEMFTLTVKDLYGSYKDLPLSIYQIQTKYRDEARPRAGLLRGREFIMKDSYSFDVDDEGLQASYDAHRAAYIKMFDRWGSTTSSSRRPPGRWAVRRPRSSSRRRRTVRTPTCAAPRATMRRTSRPFRCPCHQPSRMTGCLRPTSRTHLTPRRSRPWSTTSTPHSHARIVRGRPATPSRTSS